MPEETKKSVTNKVTYITIPYMKNKHRAVLTQEFFEDFDFGHWKFVVFDDRENIIHVSQSSNAPPDRICIDMLICLYNRFYFEWKKMEKNLKSAGFSREK